MTSFQIKVLACLIMLIDHIGAIMFPGVDILRAVGRIAFPLFAWLLANGWRHTANRPRYVLRLLTFALLSQIPFITAFQPSVWRWNVLFSLAAGIACLAWCERKSGWPRYAVIAAIAILAEILLFDHGSYGILTIVCFGRFANSFAQMAAAQAVLIGVRQIVVYTLACVEVLSFDEWWVWAQPVALLSLLVISCYNGRKGMGAKFLFYCFYPVHLLLLSLLRLC